MHSVGRRRKSDRLGTSVLNWHHSRRESPSSSLMALYSPSRWRVAHHSVQSIQLTAIEGLLFAAFSYYHPIPYHLTVTGRIQNDITCPMHRRSPCWCELIGIVTESQSLELSPRCCPSGRPAPCRGAYFVRTPELIQKTRIRHTLLLYTKSW